MAQQFKILIRAQAGSVITASRNTDQHRNANRNFNIKISAYRASSTRLSIDAKTCFDCARRV